MSVGAKATELRAQEAAASYLVELPAQAVCPKGYKQTEVGVMPEDWKCKSLASMSAFITKGSTPTTYGHKWEQSGILFLRSECVSENGLDLTQSMFISHAAHAALRRSEVRDGDILVTITGNVGRVVYLQNIGCANLNQHIARVRISSDQVERRYIYHYLSQTSVRRHFNSITTGQAYPQISLKQVREAVIPLPPTKAEQEAIAGALSDADALIESLEQLIAKKRQLKQGAMQELLTGKKRLPGFSEEWEVKRLGQLAKIQRGASPRPIDSPIWFNENSSVGWVRISDVTSSGMYLKETTQRLSHMGIQNSRPVSRGSLIMSICATVGRPIITEIDVCIHDGFVVFDSLGANKYFIYYVLKFIEGDWYRHGQTGSQMNLNTGLINETEVQLPPTEKEQSAIGAILSNIDTEIAALEARLAKARDVKQGMMQELLTGKTRLK